MIYIEDSIRMIRLVSILTYYCLSLSKLLLALSVSDMWEDLLLKMLHHFVVEWVHSMYLNNVFYRGDYNRKYVISILINNTL